MYEIKPNAQFNSNEIYFNGKPSQATRDALKAAGFRWHGVKKCWYGRATAEEIAATINGTGEQGGTVAQAATTAKKEQRAELANIQFYWNGIKIDGKLYRCYYSMHASNNDNIVIYGKDYDRLPRGFFPVTNDSDIYTDYFEEDRGEIATDSPLYSAAKWAAVEAELHTIRAQIKCNDKYMARREARGLNTDYYKTWNEEANNRIKAFEAKQGARVFVTVDDLKKLDQQKQEAENRRKEEEHAEELRRREAENCKRVNGRHLIEKQREAFPITAGAPYVHINWSEYSAFYEWNDKSADDPNALLLSLTAADNILRQLDTEEADKNRGYDKTRFTIYYTDQDTNEASSYGGRYDLGDNEGGLIAHIEAFGKWYETHDFYGHNTPSEESKQQAAQVARFVEYLRASMAA